MNKPLVSIIIPVFNGELYIKESITSALSQTYKNIEVIVVNDGSTDESRKIVEEFGSKVKLINKINGGSSSALNEGVKNANGDLVVWLSHDDLLGKKAIKNRVKAFLKKNKENYIPFEKTHFIDSNGERLRRKSIRNKKIYRLCQLYRKSLNGCSLLLPKKVFTNNFFSEKFVYLNDFEFWARLIEQGYVFFPIKSHQNFMRIHDNQVSIKKKHLYEIEFKTVFERFVCPLMQRHEHDQLFSILKSFVIRSRRYTFYKHYIDLLSTFLKEEKYFNFFRRNEIKFLELISKVVK